MFPYQKNDNSVKIWPKHTQTPNKIKIGSSLGCREYTTDGNCSKKTFVDLRDLQTDDSIRHLVLKNRYHISVLQKLTCFNNINTEILALIYKIIHKFILINISGMH